MPVNSRQTVHVAAGVILDGGGRILIARRLEHAHQGGLWEFPGGKVDAGETVAEALCRELFEELGITAREYSPFLEVRHDYPDKSVLLDVWQVTAFSGEPHGREGQPVQWVAADTLGDYSFPPANLAIVEKILSAG